jgi:hypothetical protein
MTVLLNSWVATAALPGTAAWLAAELAKLERDDHESRPD